MSNITLPGSSNNIETFDDFYIEVCSSTLFIVYRLIWFYFFCCYYIT